MQEFGEEQKSSMKILDRVLGGKQPKVDAARAANKLDAHSRSVLDLESNESEQSGRRGKKGGGKSPKKGGKSPKRGSRASSGRGGR